jgi:hypothetical protein
MPRQHEFHYLPQDTRERLAILAIVVAGLFVFGDDVNRWFSQQKQNFRTAFREKMPIDVEIERAREMATSLMPDLRRNHEAIVREQIDTEELRREIQVDREFLLSQREELLRMRSQISSATQTTSAPSHAESAQDSRETLRRAFEAFQSSEDVLRAREQVLRFREDALTRAETVQNGMLKKKEELELQVVELESRLQLIRKEGIDSQVTLDQEKLGRCEELLSHLRKRLTIAERISSFDETAGATGAIQRGSETEEHITLEEEIDRYFRKTSI